MATPEQAARLERQDLSTLGGRVRDARRAKGLGQSDIASAVGVSISYMSRIEAGKRRADITLLTRIADSLGTSVEAFLDPDPSAVAPSSTALAVRPPDLDFSLVSLEMGDAATALARLEALETVPEGLRYEAGLLRSRALEALGRLGEAIEVLEPIVAAESDAAANLAGAIALSRCYREGGEVGRAIMVGERSLEALKQAGLSGGDEAVQLAVTTAAAYFERGDREYAVRLCRRTVEAAEAAGTARARASAYWNFAIMDMERGNADGAVVMARRALALLGEGQDARNLGRLHNELGLMELRLSPPDLEAAEAHLLRAKELLTASSASVVDVQRVRYGLAKLKLLEGNAREATTLALAVSESLADRSPQLEASALVVAGEAAETLNDRDAARQHFLGAVAILHGVDDARSVAQLWMDLGSRLESLGDTTAASDAFRRAAVAAGLAPASSPAITALLAD